MPEEFGCPECGNSYDTKRGLSVHIGQKHPDNKEEIKDEVKEGSEEKSSESEEQEDVFPINVVSTPIKLGIFILLLIVLGGLVFYAYGMDSNTTGELTASEAGQEAVGFLEQLPQLQGASVSLLNSTETGSDVYEINVEISAQGQTQTNTHYISEDGKLLFPNAEIGTSGEGLSEQELGEKVAETMRSIPQIQQSNTTVEFLENVGIKSGVYEVKISISDPRGLSQNMSVYVTEDSKYVFPQGLNITEQLQALEEQQDQEEQQQEVQDIKNKTETPTAQLFVQSFCPYGNQAENTMEPVHELLGEKVNWEPHYIVRETEDGFESLHGQVEVDQDKRELCVLEDKGLDKWFDFVTYINDNCGSEGECWETAAEETGINSSSVSDCVDERGDSLLRKEAEITAEKGVRGSPTLIINGQETNAVYKYGNSDAYKDIICSAFTEGPEQCTQTLSADTASSSSGGSC